MAISIESTDARARRVKSVLFCPECDYDSPITDNWLAVTSGDDRVLVCPACGAVVDRRTRPPDHAGTG